VLPGIERQPRKKLEPSPERLLAVLHALKDGHLGGAALGVWWQYPTPAEPERGPSRRPFHELPNVLMTPHCSSSSDATAVRRWSAVAGNLDRFARGEPLYNVLCFRPDRASQSRMSSNGEDGPLRVETRPSAGRARTTRLRRLLPFAGP
jgi:hypothetical protein